MFYIIPKALRVRFKTVSGLIETFQDYSKYCQDFLRFFHTSSKRFAKDMEGLGLFQTPYDFSKLALDSSNLF